MDILEIFNSSLGGPIIHEASIMLGESEEQTRTAARSVGPALLAGLLQHARGPAGANEIFKRVTDPGIDAAIVGRLPALLQNRGNYESLLSTGQSLVTFLFGGRTGSVASAIADASGVRGNSALTLLSIGAPVLFGMLRKHVMNNDLDAAAFNSLLTRQQHPLAKSKLDPRVAGALGFGGVPEFLASLPKANGSAGKPFASKTRERTWMPWAGAAAIMFMGLLFFVSRTSEYQETPSGSVRIAEVPDRGERLKIAQADSAKVYFETGDASIGRDDRDRIASVAETAKHSDRPVAITGYADRTGDEDKNYELAKDRAWAVRDALVEQGVSESQIVMDPPKSVTGAGPNDEARRVDIDMR